ncbi:N-acetylneuraminate synthase [bacterium]|nr:N-acetylneuraminate synthase [bacterium]
MVTTGKTETIRCGQRMIGPGQPCFIIAEAGVNHNGRMDLAFSLVDLAVEAGVDAIKFQTFKSDKVVSSVAPKADYQLKNGPQESMLEMVRKLELNQEQTGQLAAYCRERQILFLSTAFDPDSVDFLDRLGVPVFKVGSGELTNHLLLEHIAQKGKPILLSTGMATLAEVGETVLFLKETASVSLALFHCVSSYPAAPEECNLRAMDTLSHTFNVPIGWSDHTPGLTIALAAVARGAHLLEKHFTLDQQLPGPDHQASLNPGELKALVREVRQVEAALGDGTKLRSKTEENVARVARRSLFSAHRLHKGQTVTRADLIALRPGTGIPPNRLELVLGKKLRRDIQARHMLHPDDLEE